MSGKVAAIQMCSGKNLTKNLKDAAALLEVASNRGAKLAVLPEMFPLFGYNGNDKTCISETYGAGKVQSFLSDIAKKLGMWVVSGTIPIKSFRESKIRAASIVYDDQGVPVARYDKIHLFDVDLPSGTCFRESDTTEPGESIMTANSPVGKLGLSVCYDIRFPHMYREMAQRGAEILTIPSAFTVETGKAHWSVLARARAIETFSYVIGACQAGAHENGRVTYGHSIIIDPWGNIVSESQVDGEDVICAEIDLTKVHKARKSIPSLIDSCF